jgi:hypothetical protein
VSYELNMMPSSRLLRACLAAVVATTASSFPAFASEPPATLPAAVVTLDQSSPKALLRSFYASHGEVDAATIRSLLHATTPVEQKILDAVVQVEVASAQLRAAEKAKFGAAKLPSSVAATPQPFDVGSVTDLETLTEKIEGDRATVSSPMDPKVAMEFVRVDGKWKLPIAAQLGGAAIDPAMAETLGTATRAQIEIIDAVTADVKAGKFVSEEQVKQELSRRFAEKLASATRPSSSATQPATAPLTPPGT